MDGIVVKKPVMAGLVTRYRSMTKTRQAVVETTEKRSVSLRVEDRQAALCAFYQVYESLIEVLCDAAQLGASPKLEASYRSVRMDLNNRYGDLRNFLGAYLRHTGEDRRGVAMGIRFDAFDALLAPATLEMFLQTDDGYTISRVTRTREALNLYAEHLKQLSERLK
jgi:hypothetical protein